MLWAILGIVVNLGLCCFICCCTWFSLDFDALLVVCLLFAVGLCWLITGAFGFD